MSSGGLFENLELIDDGHRVASRKAVSVARARANKRFAKFLESSTQDEREAKLALVAGDLTETVKQACADCDHEDWEGVLTSVQEHLGMQVESRRPKMCPFHREVTDISLQSGDPQAGFSAMAQHTFGENSCRGGTWEGRCNFKPEMTTQSFWDKKDEEREERRKQRAEQTVEPQEVANEDVPEQLETPNLDAPTETEPVVDDATNITEQLNFEDWGDSYNNSEPEMAMAASVRKAAMVPNPLIHGGSLAPLGKIDQNVPGLMVDGQPFQTWASAQQGMPQYEAVDVIHPHPTWEGVAADILRVGHDGPLRQEMQRRRDLRAQQQQGIPPQQAKTAETLETVDVTKGGETPSPKMDKRIWTPENVNFLDLESDGSPHKTVHQDIAEPAMYSPSDDPLKQDAVLERQDVTQGTELPHSGQGGTFGQGKHHADPVTSALDPDKNPIRESLEDPFDFPSEDEVKQAIAAWGDYPNTYPQHEDVNYGLRDDLQDPHFHGDQQPCMHCQGAGCDLCGGTGVTPGGAPGGARVPGTNRM